MRKIKSQRAVSEGSRGKRAGTAARHCAINRPPVFILWLLVAARPCLSHHGAGVSPSPGQPDPPVGWVPRQPGGPALGEG